MTHLPVGHGSTTAPSLATLRSRGSSPHQGDSDLTHDDPCLALVAIPHLPCVGASDSREIVENAATGSDFYPVFIPTLGVVPGVSERKSTSGVHILVCIIDYCSSVGESDIFEVRGGA